MCTALVPAVPEPACEDAVGRADADDAPAPRQLLQCYYQRPQLNCRRAMCWLQHCQLLQLPAVRCCSMHQGALAARNLHLPLLRLVAGSPQRRARQLMWPAP